MIQYLLTLTFIVMLSKSATAQSCAPGDPTAALGTYCKSDFDGGKVIPPPPSPLDDPDPQITPGVTNPRVTQANIGQNICSKDFRTAAFRPKPAYTNALKRKQLREYGDTVKDPNATCAERSNNPRCYEEDHLIALEDGGNPFDPRNLWPEPTNKMPGVNGAGWESKDLVLEHRQEPGFVKNGTHITVFSMLNAADDGEAPACRNCNVMPLRTSGPKSTRMMPMQA